MVYAGLAALAFGIGWALGRWAIVRWRRSDPGQVVIDEVAGLWTALACCPPWLLEHRPLSGFVTCFLLFRLFDVAKPWPLSSLERIGGGLGIMADDLGAGLLAGIVAVALLP